MGAAIRPLNLACVAVLALGCGGLGTPTKVRDAGAPFGTGVVADFVNAYLPLLCQYDVACHVAFSVDGCGADLSAFWRRSVGILQSEVDSGRINYDADRAASCLRALQSAPCPSFSNGRSPFALGCAGVFRGTVATAAPCVFDTECASGHCRWTLLDTLNCTDSCCPGACAALADVGASCFTDDRTSDCVSTAYCKGPAYVSNGTCQAKLYQGETCEQWSDCQDGLTCDSDSSQCVPYPKDGQPCSVSSGCDNYDSYCDPSRGTCQARLEVGAPCLDHGDDGCGGYAQCLNGICTLLPGAGEACTVLDGGNPGALCRWYATSCIDGICQEPDFPPPCSVATVQPQDAGAMLPDAPASQVIDAGPVATDALICLAYGLVFGVGETYHMLDSSCVYTCLVDGSWGISDCGADP